jgi:hypothetical protein
MPAFDSASAPDLVVLVREDIYLHTYIGTNNAHQPSSELVVLICEDIYLHTYIHTQAQTMPVFDSPSVSDLVTLICEDIYLHTYIHTQAQTMPVFDSPSVSDLVGSTYPMPMRMLSRSTYVYMHTYIHIYTQAQTMPVFDSPSVSDLVGSTYPMPMRMLSRSNVTLVASSPNPYATLAISVAEGKQLKHGQYLSGTSVLAARYRCVLFCVADACVPFCQKIFVCVCMYI